jgi:H+/gluconate symporter-like permease
MPSIKIGLVITAGLIITFLALYAAYLHIQLKTKQQATQIKEDEERKLAQKNLDKRNNNIIKDIRFIAQALVTEQCEITEGVLRIHHLADALDSDIMQQQVFATLHQHFNACKSMAIKNTYKDLTKKQRFQQDQLRFRLEQENTKAVLAEAQLIIRYSFENLKNLH